MKSLKGMSEPWMRAQPSSNLLTGSRSQCASPLRQHRWDAVTIANRAGCFWKEEVMCVSCGKGLIVPMLWLARGRLAEGTERPFIIKFCWLISYGVAWNQCTTLMTNRSTREMLLCLQPSFCSLSSMILFLIWIWVFRYNLGVVFCFFVLFELLSWFDIWWVAGPLFTPTFSSLLFYRVRTGSGPYRSWSNFLFQQHPPRLSPLLTPEQPTRREGLNGSSAFHTQRRPVTETTQGDTNNNRRKVPTASSTYHHGDQQGAPCASHDWLPPSYVPVHL